MAAGSLASSTTSCVIWCWPGRRASVRRAFVGGPLWAAGVALLLIGALVGGVLTFVLRAFDTPPAVVAAKPAPRPTVSNGWVAFAAGRQGSDSDIYLVKQGSPAHRILGSDSEKADQVCPAFSPDGSHLVAGQVSDDGSGGANAALVITKLTADGQPSDTTTVGLDGVTDPPCATWSGDGRWLALGVSPDERGYLPRFGEVWVIDTRTSEIRRLTGLGATDIEWSPTSPELFIAGDGITVYSTATDKTRRVANTAGAVAISFSPDGRSLAVERDANGDADGPSTLLLMGADGSDQRILVASYDVFHGIGPVWSPDGSRVAFQRLCATYVIPPDEVAACREVHEVVVVTITDHDPLGPPGTLTVIAPPHTSQGGEARAWAPYSVSWSPDSTTLLYIAWSSSLSADYSHGILAVPVDSAEPAVILEDALDVESERCAWNWARQRV